MLEGEAHVPEYIFKAPYTQQWIGKPIVPYDHEEVCQSGVTSGLRCGHVLNERQADGYLLTNRRPARNSATG